MEINHDLNFTVFGDPIQNAIEQMEECMKSPHAVKGALMADHHLGYDMPIGGVIAYRDHVSPTGVGFDIGCGNKAIMLEDFYVGDVEDILSDLMDEITSAVPAGVGSNCGGENADHEIFNNSEWEDIPILAEHKELAQLQLGSIGSGNHYVDIFRDRFQNIWVGCHFGSRGIGHKVASFYIDMAKKCASGNGGLLHVDSPLGLDYLSAMTICGEYAAAGRDIVTARVADALSGGPIEQTIHNHHNFCWKEEIDGEPLYVVRKGATPAYENQAGFIGATMAEPSAIVHGNKSILSGYALNSTVHGAGRLMSRTQAAGKCKWIKGVKTRVAAGEISQEMMDTAMGGIIRRGGGLDEAPAAYKRLDNVLHAQGDTIRITERLWPLAVYMAGGDL